MSRIQEGATNTFFHTPAEIAAYLLNAALTNQKQALGVEWEVVFNNESGDVPTVAQTQEIVRSLLRQYQKVYGDDKATPVFNHDRSIFAINLPNGAICLEPGGQVEFAGNPCVTIEAVEKDLQEFEQAAATAAATHGFTLAPKGLEPKCFANVDLSRDRYAKYLMFLQRTLGQNQGGKFLELMAGACSLQVNLDAGGENFHEIYRALLVLEPLVAVQNRTSNRQHQLLDITGAADATTGMGPQTAPIAEAWDAPDAASIIDCIVRRMMTAPLPMLPNPDGGEHYIPTFDVNDPNSKPQTLTEILTTRPISERDLKTILGFMLHQPSMRRPGVLETRATDSPATAAKAAAVCTTYQAVIYMPEKRRALLDACAGLTAGDIRQLHLQLAKTDHEFARSLKLSDGTNVGTLLDLVTSLGNAQALRPSVNQPPLAAPST